MDLTERIRRQSLRFELSTGSRPRVALVNPEDRSETPDTVDGIAVGEGVGVPRGNVWVMP